MLRLLMLVMATSVVAADASPADKVTLSAWQKPEISVTGSVRTRYSYLENQFRPLLDDDDQALSLRTLLRFDARLTPTISLVTEFQDSRAYLTDDNSGASTIVVNTAALLQAHVSFNRHNAFQEGDQLNLKLGRFTMDVGSRRLVARNRYRNTIQNFTGASAEWRSSGGTRVMGFYTLPVAVEPFLRRDVIENKFDFDRQSSKLQLWHLRLEQPDVLLGGGVELYLFGLAESDGAYGRPTRNRRLLTPGLRFVRPPRVGAWDFDLETVWQLGTRRATPLPDDEKTLDVFAHFHHVELGFTAPSPWQPRLSLELDYATGDDSPDDNEFNRFDSLYGPRRTDFGPTGIYGLLGRSNIISAGLRLGLKPNDRADG